MMNAIDIAVRDGADNRAAVWKFFQDYPCHTKAECAAKLGLSAKTVGGHCRAIRKGWRPPAPSKVCGLCGAPHG